ncbi:uncharacterized protein LOC126899182 [Daktulosphaira vitifoliae]|uniref:uncharacterized protein LOC126899182 n=1 Tax=Daktulosphaira vitifoliae TaxID=58002 RepID=UPI0021AB0684|nr:uncharacterized protein LOC126899182 [Daktulosphaira vitifoliae]
MKFYKDLLTFYEDEDTTIQKPETSKTFQSKKTLNVGHVKKITKKQTTINKRQVKNSDALILKRKNQTRNKSNAKISTKNKSNSINVEIPSEAVKHMNPIVLIERISQDIIDYYMSSKKTNADEIVNNYGEQENVRINNSETHKMYRKKNRTPVIDINIRFNPHYVGKRPSKRKIIKFYKDLLTFDEDEDSRIQKPETSKTFQSKKRAHLDDVNDSRKKLRLTNKYEDKENNSYTLNSNRKNKTPDVSNVEISTENKSNPINVEIPSDKVNHMNPFVLLKRIPQEIIDSYVFHKTINTIELEKLVNNIELSNNVDGINNFDTPSDNPTKNKKLSTNSSTKKVSKKKRSKRSRFN